MNQQAEPMLYPPGNRFELTWRCLFPIVALLVIALSIAFCGDRLTAPGGNYDSVPTLMGMDVPRPHVTRELRRLLHGHSSGVSGCIGMWGLQCAGKTTELVRLGHDRQVRKLFYDGIFFFEFPRTLDAPSQMLIELFSFACMLSSAWQIRIPTPFQTAEQAQDFLHRLFRRRRALLLLDNIANFSQGLPFWKALPVHSAMVFTTVDIQIIHALEATVFTIPEWSEDEAIHLLKVAVAESSSFVNTTAAREVVNKVERLPLVVKAIGGSVRSGQKLEAVLVNQVNGGKLDSLLLTGAYRSHFSNVEVALQSSIDTLGTDSFKSFCIMLPIRDGTWIGAQTQQHLWGDGFLDVRNHLVGRGIILGRSLRSDVQVRLHAVVRSIAIRKLYPQSIEWQEMQRAWLVQSFRVDTAEKWPLGCARDPYMRDMLVHHAAELKEWAWAWQYLTDAEALLEIIDGDAEWGRFKLLKWFRLLPDDLQTDVYDAILHDRLNGTGNFTVGTKTFENLRIVADIFKAAGWPSKALVAYEQLAHLAQQSGAAKLEGKMRYSAAWAYEQQGNRQAAIMQGRLAVDILSRAIAENSQCLDLSIARNKLVESLLEDDDRLDEAEALILQERASGVQHHAHVAGRALMNHGRVLLWKARQLPEDSSPKKTSVYGEALGLMRQSLQDKINLLGDAHPHTAKTHESIAELLIERLQFNEAIEELDKSITIRMAALGHGHKDLAISFYLKAVALQGEGATESAATSCCSAFHIFNKSLGPAHPRTVKAITLLQKLQIAVCPAT